MDPKTQVGEKVALVRGSFTPSEASDLLKGLIDEKINFHKLQRLRWCEGYFKADTSYADTRIAELEAEKDKIRSFIRAARASGKMVQISGNITMTLEGE